MNSDADIEAVVDEAERTGARAGEARHRARLLFLCQTLPFPPDGGVQIRTYNVLRLLAREFDVTALCFFRRADRQSPADVNESVAGLRALARVEAFPIPQEHSRARFLADHARSALRRRAYTVYAYESAAFRERLDELLRRETFDLAHVDSLDLSGYLPALRGLPVVCVHHNVESALLARRAATATGPAASYLRFQARLTEEEERRWCDRVALNVAVSPEDADALRALAPAARIAVVPNGVDTREFQPRSHTTEAEIVFVGGYGWQPNRDAMEFFCQQVLPRIRERGITAPVTWIGRAPEAVRREYEVRHGVTLTGYVDDIRPIVTRAACYVAPLRAGGGTRLKILDAWAMGKAVVSTAVGCEGLAAVDGDNILVRDEPSAFAEAVASVLRDAALRDRLGAAARRTAEERYDWEVIGRSMMPHYWAAIAHRTGGSPRSRS